MKPTLFVFGLGYVGVRVGLAAQELGWRVCGSVRAVDRAEELYRATGIEAHTFDLDEEYSGLSSTGLLALADASHLLCTVPPVADLDRDPLLALHGADVMQATSESGRLRWAGYLSTTSVYGDHSGAWVDESSETRAPAGSAGFHRLGAEREWLDLQRATDGRLETRVFRLAGIYGPGRSALDTVARAAAKQQAEDGDPPSQELTAPPPAVVPHTHAGASASSATPPPRYVSRVHVDDICAALLASMQQAPLSAGSSNGDDGRVFNVADDDPAPRVEVMEYASGLLGVPPRAAAAATGAPSGGSGGRARRRATEHKRVSNARLRSSLMPEGLTYPSYREGLRSINGGAAAAD